MVGDILSQVLGGQGRNGASGATNGMRTVNGMPVYVATILPQMGNGQTASSQYPNNN